PDRPTKLPSEAAFRTIAACLGVAALTGCGGSSNALTAVSQVVRTSLSHTFSVRVTLTGAAALGAKAKEELQAAGVVDEHRGLSYERVDLPGPLDRNKQPPRDFLIFTTAKIL